MGIKVYLDDDDEHRPTPKGWHRCHWPDEVIALLLSTKVDVVSLDHDLGDDARGTGYDVLAWLEERVALDPTYVPPEVRIHTANPSARDRMLAAVRSVSRLLRSR